MSEYIEREKLLLALKEWQNKLIGTYGKNDEYVRCLESVFIGIEDVPAADVRPVVRGKWKLYGADKRGRGGIFVCLACEKSFPYKTNFCPNCGADMRGTDDAS